MRTTVLIALMFSVTAATAQTVWPGSLMNYTRPGVFENNIQPVNHLSEKKWSFSRYTALSTSMAFFKGGSATIVSAPIGLQLNRRLTNNWYAFANVAVAPSYTNFNSSFLSATNNKAGLKNGLYNSHDLNMYSSASLGLMYINEEKTFSISGSISVEKNNFPLLPYYPVNVAKPNPVLPVNR